MAALAARRPATGGADTDTGTCLSMHQPWASLLVYGIKRIEGRGWPTEHRGRLWIAATAREPSPQEIEEMESFYRAVHCEGGGCGDPQFPPAYPTGVLLGCVEVADCLQAEQVEAWDALPAGLKAEVGSPYCFLCQAAQRLVVPQQMRGWPKLFALEKKVHKAAQLGLKPAPNSQEFRWAEFGPPPAADGALPPAQNKDGFRDLQRRMGVARAGSKHGSERDASEHGSGRAARTADCQSPRAAGAAGAAASGLPQTGQAAREAAPQQTQQAQQAQQDPAKRLRALQKKLRQIAALEERQRGGQALQDQELEKLGQKAQLEAEAASLLAATDGG
ncbi:hypothetical protein ABPG77_009866 [Micractinium sp. CCAP 211/92]